MRGQNGAKRGQTLDKLNPYGQKIPNACPRYLLSLPRFKAGCLGRAHRALRLPTLGWWCYVRRSLGSATPLRLSFI